jgi:hypothetical protein
VRISLGRFDPAKYEEVRRLLDQSQKTLLPVIRALNGNVAYYVGLDRENCTISNVSIWQTLEDAKQMASLQAMLDLAQSFADAGVRFESIASPHSSSIIRRFSRNSSLSISPRANRSFKISKAVVERSLFRSSCRS